jgi:nucleoside 2-deoxyribosyltransferase
MDSEKKVYLAGPIRGLTYEGCVDWREQAKEELGKDGIIGVSPMRNKEFLKNVEKITDDRDFLSRFEKGLAGKRGITTRDRLDATGCDVILANLLGAKDVSIGTMIEYGWSDAFRIPMVTVMEKEGNVHEHLIVDEITSYRAETLEEGLSYVRSLLVY